MNLVDSSGWIEFFLAGPNGPLFKPVIEQRDALLVPVIALFEVHKVLSRKVQTEADEACLIVMRLGSGWTSPTGVLWLLPTLLRDKLAHAASRWCDT
jgi:hypothetical protein